MPSKTRYSISLCFLMTLLLTSSMLGCPSIASAEVRLENNSYVMSIQDGRDLLELIDTQDAEIQELWKAINKKDEQIDSLILASEKLVNKTYQLETKLVKEKAKRFGIGIFAGLGHSGEAVVGIGITYSLFKF